MPLIEKSTYQAPLFLKNGHLQTIYPSLFRQLRSPDYRRTRLELEDGDFIDLDWSSVESTRLCVLLHGLESNSQAKYIKGMVLALNKRDCDTVVINLRGCSGELNRLLVSYHSGSSEDLNAVIKFINRNFSYRQVYLVGFSLGGNIVLKFLGESEDRVRKWSVQRAAVVSVPCDLATSALRLTEKQNYFYQKRFLRSMLTKYKLKQSKMQFSRDLSNIHTITDFDELYTAPVHGFKSANDYWEKCSSKHFIHCIRIPTLVLNALNDPILTGGCYPIKESQRSSFVYLETPRSGGHVGFVSYRNQGEYWHEERICSFLFSSGIDLENIAI